MILLLKILKTDIIIYDVYSVICFIDLYWNYSDFVVWI